MYQAPMPLTLTLFHICFIYASTYSAYFEMLLNRFLPRFNDNISAAISRRTKCFESPHNALQTSFWYVMYIYILFTQSLVFNYFAGCMSWNCSSLLLVYILCIFKNSNLIFWKFGRKGRHWGRDNLSNVVDRLRKQFFGNSLHYWR